MESAIDAKQTGPAAQSLLKLRQAFIDAHAQLPPYDQRKCEAQIREIELRLDATKTSKPRFAFKRRATPAGGATPGSSSGATTPAGGDAGTTADGAAGPSGSHVTAKNTPAEGAATPSAAGASTGVAVGAKPKGDGYALSSRSNCRLSVADVLPPVSASATGITLTLSSLASCVIDLRFSPVRNVHADSLSGCALLLPPGAGLLAHGLRRCLVTGEDFAQLRVHDSDSLVLAVDIASHPIIERCTKVYTMPAREGGKSRWDDVLDFDSPTGQSTNWRAMSAEEQGKLREGLGRTLQKGEAGDVLAAIPEA